MALEQDSKLHRRRAAAKYLQDKWAMRCAEQTLAKLACVGGGPAFQRFGRDVVYDEAELDRWARSRLSKPVRSTSDSAAA
jgi:hypothetical protein